MSDKATETVEELEDRRYKKLAAIAREEKAQYAIDLQAREALEDEHGPIAAVKVGLYRSGQPTRAFVKMPTQPQYKRYTDQIGRAVDKKNTGSVREAQELLAKSCWVYPPTDEARAAMLEAFPGLLTPLSVAAAGLAEGRAEEEGKG